LDQRIKAPFRGTIALTVPANTDTVFIGYGRQPSIEYTARPTIEWPIPGSGTYYLHIGMKWHTAVVTNQANYYVPLHVPRA
jgi:hypothetical protein